MNPDELLSQLSFLVADCNQQKMESECQNFVHNRSLIFFTTLADVFNPEVCSGKYCILLELTTADFADFDPVFFCQQTLCSWQ